MIEIENLLDQPPPKRIYHYASAAAAIGLIRDKAIWASKIRHLNDSAEFIHAREWLTNRLFERDKESGVGQLRSGIAAALSTSPIYTRISSTPTKPDDLLGRDIFKMMRNRPSVFVASFSENKNLLSQWRAYCPQGDGYALGFNATGYKSDLVRGMALVKCVYTKKKKDNLCNALIESWKAVDEDDQASYTRLITDTATVMAALKHESFTKEREWRLVGLGAVLPTQYRAGRHGIVPYKAIPYGGEGEFSLKDICIGPNTYEEAAVEAAKSIVKTFQTSEISIKISGIPLRG